MSITLTGPAACKCADCRESAIVTALIADDSVTMTESMRWAVAAMFRGVLIRCAR